MFDDFMNHKCNIYHLEDNAVNIGYGIKAESVRKPQPEAALKEVPCHFHIRMNNYLQLVQKEPYSRVDGKIKLSLPPGTDIRMNDTVEDCRDGLKYRAGKPQEVYGGHHIVVVLTREDGLKGAI